MKFKLILILSFVLSCTPQSTALNLKKPYNSKGFAYIYNDLDFNQKIIKGKMNNELMQISHQKLKSGALIKIINPKNKKSLVLKNLRRVRYPDFYKIIITKQIAEELDLNIDLPILEIFEIKKNKSFVAKKAKIFNEEKKISSKAPVASVQISNISKNKSKKSKNKTEEIYILVGSFYSINTAKLLKQRIGKEMKEFDDRKLKLKNINSKETQLISGPYTSVNLLKNDYIKLSNFGFEELDIFLNE